MDVIYIVLSTIIMQRWWAVFSDQYENVEDAPSFDVYTITFASLLHIGSIIGLFLMNVGQLVLQFIGK